MRKIAVWLVLDEDTTEICDGMPEERVFEDFDSNFVLECSGTHLELRDTPSDIVWHSGKEKPLPTEDVIVLFERDKYGPRFEELHFSVSSEYLYYDRVDAEWELFPNPEKIISWHYCNAFAETRHPKP